jgi:iron complex outermembrane recepter protein
LLRVLGVTKWLFTLVISAGLCVSVCAGEQRIDVKKQALVSALDSLSQQTHLRFIYSADHLNNIQSAPVAGTMGAESALRLLLTGTGLVYEYVTANTVQIRVKKQRKFIVDNLHQIDDTPIEEVILIGTALANRTAIAIKEQSLQIMDAYSADDIGSLPELNVADSFRRIVGLNTIMGGTDDEGQFVTIRGVSAGGNFTTFDGMAMATDSEGTRGVNLEAIPGSAVSGLEVYKSLTPNLDGHGIGGNTNMTSRSAYDKDERYFQLDLDTSQYSRKATPNDDDKLGYGLSLTYSDTFGRNNQFGFVLGVKNELIDRDTLRSDGGTRYINKDDVTQDGPIVRKKFGAYNDTKTKKKKGGMIKFEWLAEPFYSYLNAYYYEKEDDDTTLNWSTLSNTTTAQNADGSGVGETGLGLIEAYNRVTTTDSGGLHYHIEKVLRDAHEINVDISHSVATYSRPFFQSYWETDNDSEGNAYREELGYSYDDSSYYPSWRFNDPDFASDGSNYHHSETQFQTRDSRDEVTEIRTDYTFNIGYGDQGWGAGAGIKYRNNQRKVDGERFDYKTAEGVQLSVADFQTDDLFVPDHFSSKQPVFDNDAYWAYFQSNPDQFDDISETRSAARFDYSFDEDVSAVYGLGRFASNTWSVLGGLRYEKTRMTSDGASYDSTRMEFEQVNIANRYGDLLPSINFTWNITDELRFRAAMSKAIGRPDPNDFKPISLFREKNGTRTISTNNQNLAPRSSDNIDIATEYYFDGFDAIASMAVFHKKIKNLPIRSITTVEVDEAGTDGKPINEIVYKNVFNSDNAEIYGVELNFVQNSLWFLPKIFHGFGVSTNVTLLKSKITYTNQVGGEKETVDHLLEQPGFIANAILFYKFLHGRGEARIAYQYTDEYSAALELNGDPRDEQYFLAYEQYDINLRYEVTDNTIIKFKVRNLTDTTRVKADGIDHNHFKNESTFGRSLWLGLTYQF